MEVLGDWRCRGKVEERWDFHCGQGACDAGPRIALVLVAVVQFPCSTVPLTNARVAMEGLEGGCLTGRGVGQVVFLGDGMGKAHENAIWTKMGKRTIGCGQAPW